MEAARFRDGPFSKAEALSMCGTGDSALLLRTLILLEQSPDAQKLIQKLKLKAAPEAPKFQDI